MSSLALVWIIYVSFLFGVLFAEEVAFVWMIMYFRKQSKKES